MADNNSPTTDSDPGETPDEIREREGVVKDTQGLRDTAPPGSGGLNLGVTNWLQGIINGGHTSVPHTAPDAHVPAPQSAYTGGGEDPGVSAGADVVFQPQQVDTPATGDVLPQGTTTRQANTTQPGGRYADLDPSIAADMAQAGQTPVAPDVLPALGAGVVHGVAGLMSDRRWFANELGLPNAVGWGARQLGAGPETEAYLRDPNSPVYNFLGAPPGFERDFMQQHAPGMVTAEQNNPMAAGIAEGLTSGAITGFGTAAAERGLMREFPAIAEYLAPRAGLSLGQRAGQAAAGAGRAGVEGAVQGMAAAPGTDPNMSIWDAAKDGFTGGIIANAIGAPITRFVGGGYERPADQATLEALRTLDNVHRVPLRAKNIPMAHDPAGTTGALPEADQITHLNRAASSMVRGPTGRLDRPSLNAINVDINNDLAADAGRLAIETDRGDPALGGTLIQRLDRINSDIKHSGLGVAPYQAAHIDNVVNDIKASAGPTNILSTGDLQKINGSDSPLTRLSRGEDPATGVAGLIDNRVQQAALDIQDALDRRFATQDATRTYPGVLPGSPVGYNQHQMLMDRRRVADVLNRNVDPATGNLNTTTLRGNADAILANPYAGSRSQNFLDFAHSVDKLFSGRKFVSAPPPASAGRAAHILHGVRMHLPYYARHYGVFGGLFGTAELLNMLQVIQDPVVGAAATLGLGGMGLKALRQKMLSSSAPARMAARPNAMSYGGNELSPYLAGLGGAEGTTGGWRGLPIINSLVGPGQLVPPSQSGN